MSGSTQGQTHAAFLADAEIEAHNLCFKDPRQSTTKENRGDERKGLSDSSEVASEHHGCVTRTNGDELRYVLRYEGHDQWLPFRAKVEARIR
jgi:hypothetical protein